MTRNSVASVVSGYAESHAGQRGIDAYNWLVCLLQAHPGSTSTAVSHGSSSAVVTVVDGAVVLHSLSGEAADSAVLLMHARDAYGADTALRGLALPGDRQTKNLFEEAGLPAQVLLH
ncbi:MAG: hypothetical protein FJW44_04960 [Actinobacteria bacterium]|nr:hypothetical protein [Actinomycetota bacterium]